MSKIEGAFGFGVKKFGIKLWVGYLWLFLLLLTIICVSVFSSTVEILKNIQRTSTANFYYGMEIFKDDLEAARFADLQNDINEQFALDSQYFISYTVVLNKACKIVYSSLPEGSVHTIDIDNKYSLPVFKVTEIRGDDRKLYRQIFIEYGSYYVYFLIKNTDAGKNLLLSPLRLLFLVFLVVCTVAALFLSGSITKPLKKIEKTIAKIEKGDLSERLDYETYDEINVLIDAYNKMADSMQRLYSSLEAEVAKRTKDLKHANAELKNTQAMMLHSEKMKSLGELVAGIMHEINNPINFIYGNMVHLGNYSSDLINIIDEYSKLDEALSPENKKRIKDLKDEVDYEFLKTDLPDLIKSCKEGADRAKNIIQDLKSFSRMEDVSANKIDLNHEIDLTLNILHNKIKNKAEVHKEYPADLPQIEAYGGQLNQVFMNILDNAVSAIEDKGDIWIRINHDKDKEKLRIEIEDNGSGMDEETAGKIFNPFFTTKPVGKGTGLGLSITYKIIKNHQGTISVKSKPGEGTVFTITLPIKLNPAVEKETGNKSGVENGQV